MGPGIIKIRPEYSHLAEKMESPDFQYDVRLERRWKRRCIANEMMKHHCCANATRRTVMAEEEVDEDYKFFLYNDVGIPNNVGGSDIDANTSHNSNNDDKDPQYNIFLENLRKDGNSFIFDVFADNQVFHVKYEAQEEERLCNSVNSKVQCDIVDKDYQLFLNSSRIEGESLVYMPESTNRTEYERTESRQKSSMVRQNLQVPNEVTKPPNTRPGSDVYHVAKHKCNSEVLSNIVAEEKSSMVWKNLQVPNEETETPNTRPGSDVYHVAKHKCNKEMLSDIEAEEKNLMVRQNLQVPIEAIKPPHTTPGLDVYHVAKHKCNNELLSDILAEGKSSMVSKNLQVSNEATEPPNTTLDSDVYHVAKHKRNNKMLSNIGAEDKSSMARQNLQVQNEATEPPNIIPGLDVYVLTKHKCNSEVLSGIVDEDYQLFLKSASRVGDNLVYKPENGVTEVDEEENDRSSPDLEVIVLEPSQYYENSPFICSKCYDSSFFADERNHSDRRLFSAFDPSPYRKGLMENLERPYEQKDYDELLQEAACRRQKERHRETRHGVIKRCRLSGVNKSYLELYSDLAKAIDQVKEPHRVLFLLRGFFYWLEHVTQEGAFRPWLDASCLEILQNM